MPISIPLPSLVATATGITGSAYASGFIASLSLAGIPAALQLSGPPGVSVWQVLFNRGFALMPKLAGTTAIAYLYAAYTAHQQGRNWKGLAASAALTVSIVPFTIIFMSSTNELLFKASAGTLDASQEDVATLIGRWGGVLNLVRSLLPLAGAAFGFSTLFSEE
ncbi:hypothetical protein NW761_010135 [Fusarium oxysporum]|nr:hypothetical protein NW758_007925 [Fusarium oxysporum]KAJ4082634.1 hypothetical protein NW761_010135 [Fusarium oxysporum]